MAKDGANRILDELSRQPHPLRPRYEVDSGYAVDGRPARVEVWRRSNALGDRTELVAVRTLGVLLIDEAVHDAFPADLRADIADDVASIRDLVEGSLAEFEKFTLTTLLHLGDEDLSGRRVIDAGAGSGEISVVAARRGASRLDLVDLDEDLLARAGRNLRRAGLCEDADFRLLRHDLADADGLAARLGAWDGGTTLVSNVGHWSRSYAVSNETSMALLPLLTDVDRFVGGGYASWAAGGGLKHFEEDRRQLARLGFDAEVRISKWNREHWPGSDSPMMNDRRRAIAVRRRP